MGIHKNLLNILWFGEVPRRYARYVGSAQTDLAALTLFSHDIVIFTDIFYLGHQSEIKGIIPVDDYYVHIRRRSGQDISGCMTFSSEKEFRLVLFIEKKLMKLKESERILSQNYEVLNHITTSAINLSDPDIIMREFMNKVQALLNTRSWSLLLLNRERDALYFRMTNRNVKKKLSQIKIPVGKGVAGWVASTREAIIINDVTKDARFLNEVDEAIGFETKRIMAAPLVGKGELFGVIELINKDGEKPFTEDDLESLKTMVKYGSIILHNALIFSEMEEMTKRDDLTALFNSRYQNWFLEESIRKATQYQGFLSIIFLDLDNFKSVNDNYGHLAGSSVLVDIAQLIKEAVREEDVASRYGGDEFTVIQPGLTAEESRKYAEAISRSVCNYHYRDIRLTASIGIASFPEHGSTTEAILSKADKAMYKRKMNQKNGIEIAE